ncbi:hypothetical protein Cflav_PD2436 [Pedosphaera parvula Ellin514]|uniref:Uncharacterized protein n=2 Tax=Pedosphaera TaxID=1032526 RepID=B9XKN6_PEDPL|nr:hypothetical protein Cflav_PD2436 [Pedosphaera parvula Ellin514]
MFRSFDVFQFEILTGLGKEPAYFFPGMKFGAYAFIHLVSSARHVREYFASAVIITTYRKWQIFQKYAIERLIVKENGLFKP